MVEINWIYGAESQEASIRQPASCRKRCPVFSPFETLKRCDSFVARGTKDSFLRVVVKQVNRRKTRPCFFVASTVATVAGEMIETAGLRGLL